MQQVSVSGGWEGRMVQGALRVCTQQFDQGTRLERRLAMHARAPLRLRHRSVWLGFSTQTGAFSHRRARRQDSTTTLPTSIGLSTEPSLAAMQHNIRLPTACARNRATHRPPALVLPLREVGPEVGEVVHPPPAGLTGRAQRLEDLMQQGDLAVGRKQGRPVDQLRKDAADAPHVDGGGVGLGAQQQLGGAVPQGHHLLGVGLGGGQEAAGQTKVGNLGGGGGDNSGMRGCHMERL